MSQISLLIFFSSEKELFSTKSTKKDTAKDKNIILKIWGTLFELIQTELQCSKNYFNFFFFFFLRQEAGAFGNNIKKELQKPHPKLRKYVYYIFTMNICSAYNTMQVVIFCKNVLFL